MSRRPTRAAASSRSSAAAFSTGYERPPTSSHLDLSSANDDDTTSTTSSATAKIHKKSKQKQARQNGFSMLAATACCLISLCTIYYAVIQFSYMANHHVNSSLSIHHEQKMAQQQQADDENDPNNNLHHRHNLQLPPDSIYRTELTDIYNKPQSLLQYTGSISLVVNVACEWGLTHSNYKELAVLHNKYSKRGFTVLAFPSNDFNQEKDTNEEILSYVNENFPQVNFPLFSRAPLKTNMVFQLCEKQTHEKVEWNFHKYLVNESGRAVKSYGHRVQPIDIEEDIVRLLDDREMMKVPQTH